MRISDWSSDVCSSDLHRGVGREVAVAAVLRPLDDEVGRGEVGGQGSGGAEGIDALCDQGAELGFHGDVVSRFNGPALYVSAMKGRVGGRRWHILVPHVRVLSSVNQKVAARGFGSSHPDPAAQTRPRAASETGAPSPIPKWSSRRTSTSASDCLSRQGTARRSETRRVGNKWGSAV